MMAKASGEHDYSHSEYGPFDMSVGFRIKLLYQIPYLKEGKLASYCNDSLAGARSFVDYDYALTVKF